MSPEAISPLRMRMIEDMIIRQFGDHTQRDYIRQVRAFTAFLGRSPDRLRRTPRHHRALPPWDAPADASDRRYPD